MNKFRFSEMVSYSKEIILNPYEATKGLKNEGGISSAVKYLLIVTLIGQIMPVVMICVGAIGIGGLSDSMGLAGIVVFVIFVSLIVGAILLMFVISIGPIKMLIVAFIFHNASKWQGSKGSLKEVVYSFSLL